VIFFLFTGAGNGKFSGILRLAFGTEWKVNFRTILRSYLKSMEQVLSLCIGVMTKVDVMPYLVWQASWTWRSWTSIIENY
jgi:hypothetical protein